MRKFNYVMSLILHIGGTIAALTAIVISDYDLGNTGILAIIMAQLLYIENKLDKNKEVD